MISSIGVFLAEHVCNFCLLRAC